MKSTQPRSIRRSLRRGRLRLINVAGTVGGMALQRKTNKGNWETIMHL